MVVPRSWGSGGLIGPGLDVDVVGAVLDDLKSLRAARVVIRPDPLRDEWKKATVHREVLASARRAHVVDLSEGVEGVRARLPSLTRRNLRIAEKRGVRIVVDHDGSLLPVYRQLYTMSVARWASKQNEPVALAQWRATRRDPAGKFETIARQMGEAFKLCVAFDGDTPAAAIIVLFGRTASYLRGAMNRDVAAATRANGAAALHWTAIQAACAAGCSRYHMHETGAVDVPRAIQGAPRGDPRRLLRLPPRERYPITPDRYGAADIGEKSNQIPRHRRSGASRRCPPRDLIPWPVQHPATSWSGSAAAAAFWTLVFRSFVGCRRSAGRSDAPGMARSVILEGERTASTARSPSS